MKALTLKALPVAVMVALAVAFIVLAMHAGTDATPLASGIDWE